MRRRKKKLHADRSHDGVLHYVAVVLSDYVLLDSYRNINSDDDRSDNGICCAVLLVLLLGN